MVHRTEVLPGKQEFISQQLEELEQQGYSKPVYLGKGATSRVWRVWDVSEKVHVACKISRKDRRAETEVMRLKNLNHPLFPRFIKAWTGSECSFLVMEYVPGSSLQDMVCRRGRLHWKQAVHIAVDIAEGLVYLHERSHPILFRDIKPDNVMIRQDGRVKLIDMGCAYCEEDKQSLAGTRGYSAPEQFEWENRPGVESDVYALGKLLHFMLTGKHKSWRGIPNGLRCLTEQAVCRQRRDRLPDMRSFLARLTIYQGIHPFLRCRAEWRAFFKKNRKADYYYIQNVRRGTRH